MMTPYHFLIIDNIPFEAHQNIIAMSEEAELEEDEGSGRRRGIKTLRDVQKSQLEKLMANPDKAVPIPERPKDWKPRDAPEFVRFYMGSSAGAGSEVFHVYRHLRRRENIRQQWISESAERDDKDAEFQEKLASNWMAAEEKTAKKRAKRLKKKQRKLEKKMSSKEGASKEENGAKGEVGGANADKEEDEEAVSSGGEEEEEPHFVIGGR